MKDKIAQFLYWVTAVCKGWWFYLTDDEATRQMSIDRMNICSTCPFSKNGVCQSCGCPEKAKTRVETEKCPEGKW